MKPSPLLVPEGRSTHKNGYLLGNIEAQCADESSNAAHRNSGKSYSLLSPFQAEPKRQDLPIREGRISEPGLEYLQLIFGRINKYDAHADSVVYVDNLAIRQEGFPIAGDDNLKNSVDRNGARGVHVASLTADLCHSSHDAHCASGFDEFRDGEDGVARYCALNAVRAT